MVGDQLHVVRRFGPPTKLELDGKLVEQNVLDNLLHLSKQRFLHSVIFGQGIPLFPDLPIPERGNLLDEVLNLDLWARCSESATAKHRTLELLLNEKKNNLSFLKGNFAGLESDESLKKQIDASTLHWIPYLDILTNQ